MSDEPRSFLRRNLPASFERRLVVVDPGRMREYDTREWIDALVIVEGGEIELESALGARWRFARGHILWLMGLPLRALHNKGREPVTLVAIRRKLRHRAKQGALSDQSSSSLSRE
jgi:hypothetical protein